MRKSDKEETSSQGSQKDAASKAVQPKVPQPNLISDPACRPIGLVFNPVKPTHDNPPQTVVVTGLVTIKGVAASDCVVNIVSLNANVFTPQKQAIVRANTTTTPIFAFYTPSSAIPVIYVYASNAFGATAPVGVVLNQEVIAGARDIAHYEVRSLTYPAIVASGTVNGRVTISPAAGPHGQDVLVSSDSPYFQPLQSPVHVPAGQTYADVPTTVVVLPNASYTAHLYASTDLSAIGPIDVTVPTP